MNWGSIFKAMWCMAVLKTNTISATWLGARPRAAVILAVSPFTPAIIT